PKLMGHFESRTKKNVHSSKCPHEETGNSCTGDLTAHMKALEQKQANSPRRSRQQEIVKLRAEINKTKTKKAVLHSFMLHLFNYVKMCGICFTLPS
ncbi:hypothetical protein ACQP3J_26685, partial [Escherichia coli]